ncbi:MAG: metallophosphoesterase [Phycisphaerales bacterium]|nr:metallophosphoesterase [Phycisphaerales bacterium]
MATWFFASDLHGDPRRYRTLFERIAAEQPAAVLLGGDLLPSTSLGTFDPARESFVDDFLVARLTRLRATLGDRYPRIALILGNDDPRIFEASFLAAAAQGVWEYANQRCTQIAGVDVYGYACVPPSPFRLKDWECYDVSRYVDPGCVSPEEGLRTIPIPPEQTRYRTIAEDLERLAAGRDMADAVLLAHAPPYRSHLDRAALDGRVVDHVPIDVHVGSIAIRRFIEERQPRAGLHGHIHESARLTGHWREQIGRTWCMTAAHDGPELALIRFDPAAPEGATRELL